MDPDVVATPAGGGGGCRCELGVIGIAGDAVDII